MGRRRGIFTEEIARSHFAVKIADARAINLVCSGPLASTAATQ